MAFLGVRHHLFRGVLRILLVWFGAGWAWPSVATPFFDDAALEARVAHFAGLSRPLNPTRRIVVFGDSISDTEGRLAAHTDGVMPPALLYWRSHLSNGPLWVEYFASVLKLPFVSYATAGARLTQFGNHGFLPPVLMHLWAPPLSYQIAAFDRDGGRFDAKDLVVLWIGNNDLMLEPQSASGENYCTSTLEAVSQLRYRGARQLMLVGVSDVTLTPFSRRGGSGVPVDALKRLVDAHNHCLRRGLQDIQRRYPNEHLDFIDLVGISNHVITHPANYSLKDTQNPCLTGSTFPAMTIPIPPIPPLVLRHLLGTCQEPNSHMFWDAWHPNTVVHCIATLEVLKQLGQKGRVQLFDEGPASKRCF